MADLESGRLDLWTERERRLVRSRLNRAFFRNVALRETTSVEHRQQEYTTPWLFAVATSAEYLPAGTRQPLALRRTHGSRANIRRTPLLHYLLLTWLSWCMGMQYCSFPDAVPTTVMFLWVVMLACITESTHIHTNGHHHHHHRHH
jgi:hypothetical protein